LESGAKVAVSSGIAKCPESLLLELIGGAYSSDYNIPNHGVTIYLTHAPQYT